MKAHVLITDGQTFPVCRDRLFWGIGTTSSPKSLKEWIRPASYQKPYLKMLVDMLGMHIGDVVFLYERQAGFHGVYKVKSDIFFDTDNIVNREGLSVGSQWPLRVKLECAYYFPKPVPEDLLFSTSHYENVFWIWAYRKSQGPRGCNTITPEAAEALIELLVKVNGQAVEYKKFQEYPTRKFEKINFSLVRNDEQLAAEDYLRGYILNYLRRHNGLEEIFGPSEEIEWVANNVPYHITQKNIDVLIFHKNYKYTDIPLRYRYTVVELKKGRAEPKDINQLVKYSQWVAGRLANGEVEMIQPIIMAYTFSNQTLQKAKKVDFNQRGIRTVTYRAKTDSIINFDVIE